MTTVQYSQDHSRQFFTQPRSILAIPSLIGHSGTGQDPPWNDKLKSSPHFDVLLPDTERQILLLLLFLANTGRMAIFLSSLFPISL